MDGLYPDLEDYIYEYCGDFKTSHEQLASKTLIYNPDAESLRAMMLRYGWISNDPAVLELIADGYEAFKSRTTTPLDYRSSHPKKIVSLDFSANKQYQSLSDGATFISRQQ
ncbi:hypothetical protein [Parachryseolinea silvisoli]|uniref:hypothetical protein n=1 Tax=Parachryseolinea silvisoli TaxID=2873601 RepID=UPI002265BCFA|nr:hypothetical protein [Parachryseolinea silvisoli]MCD9016721.1 hypothetical protein [Parachryseolinea silvisoli]